jgi:hypothetical protein
MCETHRIKRKKTVPGNHSDEKDEKKIIFFFYRWQQKCRSSTYKKQTAVPVSRLSRRNKCDSKALSKLEEEKLN